jgi:hypothetical protein
MASTTEKMTTGGFLSGREIVASPRILMITDVNVFSPRPPEPSTLNDTATESADAPFAIDTDVLPAKGDVVDDPRDSGAAKLRPGVFFNTRGHDLRTSCRTGGLATEELLVV